MVRMRATEYVQNDLWRRGLISGEMHSGIGEEGIVAGVLTHLRPGDAVACDHRPTGAFIARGVDPGSILLEMLGHHTGIGGGRAGHMHLMDRDRLLLADGIVGSAGPSACGFALSGLHARPNAIAVAFFGEGALNQGMLLESFNLAKVWRLPVLFVCKDNGWSITTRSKKVSAGDPSTRAAAFELRHERVSGSDALRVSRTARRLVRRVRRKRDPAILHATCVRPDGHFLGDPVLRILDAPLREGREVAGPLAGAAFRRDGAPARRRLRAAVGLGARLAVTARDRAGRHNDPLLGLRRRLDHDVAAEIDERVTGEIRRAGEAALEMIAMTPDA
jgi:pyruvate dehydrogenase E1 component alpha subunit